MRFPVIAVAAVVVLLSGCGGSPTAPKPTPPLSSVTVSPVADTLRVGEILRFTATAIDTGGTVVTVSFAWTSLDPTVFAVDGSGRVRGVSEGEAKLAVSAGGQSDTATVTVIAAQDGWFLQPNPSNGASLNDVFFLPDGRSGWAVGATGKILVTHDGGANWAVQVSNTSYTLNGVWFTSTTEGWAVGGGGTVMHTTNSGTTWTRLTNTGVGAELTDVCFAHPDTGWAVGGGGLVLRTFDGGDSWTSVFPTTVRLEGVSFADTRDGWAVGAGAILGTHDGGRSWFRVLPNITANTLYGVWRRSEPMAVAVGAQGVAPRTVAGPDSTTWQLGNAGAFNQLYGVHFPTDMIGYAVGFNAVGQVLRTDDGGMNWTPQVSNAQFRLNGVYFVDALRGWAVGANGVILHTGTGGEL